MMSRQQSQFPPHPPFSHPFLKAIAVLLSLALPSCVFHSPPISPVPKPDPLFELASSANMDYKPLQALLRDRQWQAADRETFQLLLAIANRKSQGWLTQTDVETLHCTDLQTLAQLWNYYSDGHFGFIRQQHLWESVGGTLGHYTPEIAQRFGDRVGWRKRGQWLTYDRLNFSDRAPEGHLPATTGNGVSGGVWNGVASIAHRLKYCPLIDALASDLWVRADWETLTLFNFYLEGIHTSTTSLPLEKIPCSELHEIDRLWLKHSQQRFGFSTQASLLKATGNDSQSSNLERYANFEKAVGWPIDSRDSSYDSAPLQTIPPGHFPARLGYSYETFGSGFNRSWRLSLNPDCGYN